MLKQRKLVCLFATLILCGLCTGCGGPSPVPIAGTVTVNGQPMAGRGRILFVPVDSEGKAVGGKAATSPIENGQFSMSTFTADDGVLPGLHRVEIYQDGILQPAQFEEVRTETGDTRRQTAPAQAVPTSQRVPPIYGGLTSPLRETVESPNTSLTLDVTSP